MTSDLISRKALLKDLQGTVSIVCNTIPYGKEIFTILHDRQVEIYDIIERQPTVDAMRELITSYAPCEYCKDGKSFMGQVMLFGNDGRFHDINYCPHCGRKMDGDRE